jgi:hypothetical protein
MNVVESPRAAGVEPDSSEKLPFKTVVAFLNSEAGRRFQGVENIVELDRCLADPWALRLLMEHGTLKPNPRILAASFDLMEYEDKGRWLRLQLVGGQKATVEVVTIGDVRPRPTDLAGHITAWPEPRVRRLASWQEWDPSKLRADLVLIPWPMFLIHEPSVRGAFLVALVRIAASGTPIALSPCPTVAFFVFLGLFEERGARLVPLHPCGELVQWTAFVEGDVTQCAHFLGDFDAICGPAGVTSRDLTYGRAGEVHIMPDGSRTLSVGINERLAIVEGDRGPHVVLGNGVAFPLGQEFQDGASHPDVMGRLMLAHLRLKCSDGNVERAERRPDLPSPVLKAYAGLFGIIREEMVSLVRRYVRSRRPLDIRDVDRRTPLHYAAMLGQPAIARMLLEAGADPDPVDEFGWTPLAYAILARQEPHLAATFLRGGAASDCDVPGWGALEPVLKDFGLLADDDPDHDVLDEDDDFVDELDDDDAQAVSNVPDAAAVGASQLLSSAISAVFGSAGMRTAVEQRPVGSPDFHLPVVTITPQVEVPSAPAVVDMPPAAKAPAAAPPEAPHEAIEIDAGAPAPAAADAREQSEQRHAETPVARIGTAAAPKGEVSPMFSWIGEFANDRSAEARAAVVAWMQDRCEATLDADLPAAETPVGTVISDATDDHALWAARFDNTRDGGAVWRVEFVIARTGARTYAAVRMVVLRPNAMVKKFPSIPSIVRKLAGMGAIDAGMPMAHVVQARSASDGKVLIGHLLNPLRKQPVLVISRRDEHSPQIHLPALVQGALSAVELSSDAEKELIEQLGRPHAPFGGAWRVYGPGFTGNDDGGSASHLLMPEGSEQQRTRRLLEVISLITRERIGDEEAIPSFIGARQLIREARQKLTPATVDTTALRALEDDLHTWRELALSNARERDHAYTEKKALQSELQRTRSQSEVLRLALAELRAERGRPAVEYPESFQDIEAWSAEHLGENVVLTPKAIRAALESRVTSPETVRQAFECLHVLANEYLEVRLGGGVKAREALEARCTALRVEVTPVGQASRDRRYRSQYTASLDGKSYTLDSHVRGSSSWDPTRQLRIYFHFDDAEARVVVGFLPGHLDNTHS